ncbi:MAG TPA: SLC13 family permease [Pseudonocardia sp.]|jgi:di/tricarboxylate transporter|uniref:SLC13 family permease n=1 Tax=Pseudonocardia sp. TaxID=60912 RepID=UPI002B4AD9B3|nr:SLC13 family permease [Pseudonocardia sp.]HLU60091.1 SLC13 family permease [Pseudonocardia sp.]
MSAEWLSILALVALFVVGTLLPINMGALGFVAAWLVGTYALGLSEREIIDGISGDLVLTLVGVTYLFAIARNNGTVDLIVRGAVRTVGGRVGLVPWVMFAVTAVLTAIGAASPAACAIVGPIALGFAGRHRISPLMMGMFVVHGAQAGGFSPISIYGVITNSVMRDNGLPVDEGAIFLASFALNLAMAIALFLALGGRELLGRRVAEGGPDGGPDGGPVDGTGDVDGAPSGGGGTATAVAARRTVRTDQVITLAAFVAVALVALVFERNIGFTAITAAVILTALFPKEQKGAITQIAWSTVLLVAGVSTFATILSTAGAPEAVGTWAAGLGTVLLGALVLCYVGGVTSAFASSTALLPIIIPIAVPLISSGAVSAVAVVAALAVSSTVVDVSPFSTNGALMVANRPDTISEDRYYRQILGYGVIVTVAGPLVVWAAFVLSGVL